MLIHNYETVCPTDLNYGLKCSLCMISYMCFSDTIGLRWPEIQILSKNSILGKKLIFSIFCFLFILALYNVKNTYRKSYITNILSHNSSSRNNGSIVMYLSREVISITDHFWEYWKKSNSSNIIFWYLTELIKLYCIWNWK